MSYYYSYPFVPESSKRTNPHGANQGSYHPSLPYGVHFNGISYNQPNSQPGPTLKDLYSRVPSTQPNYQPNNNLPGYGAAPPQFAYQNAIQGNTAGTGYTSMPQLQAVQAGYTNTMPNNVSNNTGFATMNRPVNDDDWYIPRPEKPAQKRFKNPYFDESEPEEPPHDPMVGMKRHKPSPDGW